MSTYSLLIFSAFASLLNGLDCSEGIDGEYRVGSCHEGIEINCIKNERMIEMIEYEGYDCNSNDSTNQTIIDCSADGPNNSDTIICRDDQLITIETDCKSYCIENDGELAGHRDGRSNSTADPIGINTQDSDDDELNSTMAPTMEPSDSTQHRRIQSDDDELTDSTMGPTMEPTMAPIDSSQHRDGGSNSTVDPIDNIQDSDDGLTHSTMAPTMEPSDNSQHRVRGLNSTMEPTMEPTAAPIDDSQHRDGLPTDSISTPSMQPTVEPTVEPTIINRLLN